MFIVSMTIKYQYHVVYWITTKLLLLLHHIRNLYYLFYKSNPACPIIKQKNRIMSDPVEEGLSGMKRVRTETKTGQKRKKLGRLLLSDDYIDQQPLAYDDLEAQGLYKSEEDKQYLENLSQLEREKVLHARYEKMQADMEMKQLLKNTKPAMTPQESALADIQKKRAERSHAAQIREVESELESEKSESEEEFSGVSDEESVSSNVDAGEIQEHLAAKTAQVQLEDIEKVRLSRDILEKWVDQVYFEPTVKECFVRTTVAASQKQQKYIICQIVEVVNDPSSPYKLGQKQTTKLLKLKYGANTKNMPMTHISNSPFTQTEFVQWKEVLEKADVPMVDKATLVAKEEQIKNALNYKYSDEEIDYMVIQNRMERLQNMDSKINISLETSQVIGQIENYQKLCQKLEQDKSDKKDKAEKLAKYKDMLNTLKKEYKMLEELKKKRYAPTKIRDTMQEFNLKGKLKQQEIDSMPEVREEEKQDTFNPFSRRNLQPQTIWNTRSGGGVPAPPPPAAKPVEQAKVQPIEKHEPPKIAEEDKKTLVLNRHKTMKLDIDSMIKAEGDGAPSAVPEIPIFDFRYKPLEDKNVAVGENEPMGDVISFREWKNRYSSQAAIKQQLIQLNIYVSLLVIREINTQSMMYCITAFSSVQSSLVIQLLAHLYYL
eukprot:TRINITY_DN2923_c0_g1_i1.p1 TRINITY_DN2923_c0_g1~~TRINITY_DN2923_c0_g1_i1.p1  ORF type:complete len:658 (-),score=96.37 TRINITY_DN2923_c0_g1_i1:1080-3053(-)